MVINSPWIMPILGTTELASPEQTALVATGRCLVPTGRVIVPTGRYVVPTDRVVVPTGRLIKSTHVAAVDSKSVAGSRYVVPTGRVIVPTGRYVVPTGRVIVPTGRYVVPTGRVIVPTSRINDHVLTPDVPPGTPSALNYFTCAYTGCPYLDTLSIELLYMCLHWIPSPGHPQH
nr:hypothetical protein [Tanacetum cinerariifolium]